MTPAPELKVTLSLLDYEPTWDDADAIEKQLLAFAEWVDNQVLAFGKECEALGLVGAADVQRLFTDQLRNALEGNALFAIREGIRDRIEERVS